MHTRGPPRSLQLVIYIMAESMRLAIDVDAEACTRGTALT